MPNGQFWYGKGGFSFKKSGGGGGRKNPPIGLITGQDYNIYNKYILCVFVTRRDGSYL